MLEITFWSKVETKNTVKETYTFKNIGLVTKYGGHDSCDDDGEELMMMIVIIVVMMVAVMMMVRN